LASTLAKCLASRHGEILSVQAYASTCGTRKLDQCTSRRGFSATGLANQSKRLAKMNIETDAVHRIEAPPVIRHIGTNQILDSQQDARIPNGLQGNSNRTHRDTSRAALEYRGNQHATA